MLKKKIPRSDKRDRCCLCLKPFKVLQPKFKMAESSAMRYPNLCRPCYEKSFVKLSTLA